MRDLAEKMSIAIGEKSLFTYTAVTAIVGISVFIAFEIGSIHENTRRIKELEVQRQKVDIRLFDRLQELEGQNGEIKRDVGVLNGKLDLLIEAQGWKHQRK